MVHAKGAIAQKPSSEMDTMMGSQRSLQGGVWGHLSRGYESEALRPAFGAPGHSVYILCGIIWDFGVRGLSSSAGTMAMAVSTTTGEVFSLKRVRLSGHGVTRLLTMLYPAHQQI